MSLIHMSINQQTSLPSGFRSNNQLMEEQAWVGRLVQLLNLWEVRAAVLSSFVAHIVLILLAGIRRRKASGVWMLFLWLAYQLSSWVAPYALSNLSLCRDTSRRQQLVAFWATFLLHHLGGPDNISAFSLEDNALSGREVLNVISRVIGASYVLYKHVYLGGGGGALIQASIIVFTTGVFKYVERALVLWRGNLGNIQRPGKKRPSRFFTACAAAASGSCSCSLIIIRADDHLNDEDAMIVAHDMLPFCRRAMADSSVEEAYDYHDLSKSRKIFSLKLANMCKVVEMELSLIYDILYTKAAVVHTSLGYILRVASPLAIAAATVLFGVYNKEGQSIPDVIITYALLLATFLLDIRWLLRALVSTWTHAFLQSSWLHHVVLCTRRWHRLRSVVVSLDITRLCLTAPPRSPSSYRRWSGTVGKYNLLQECARKISTCGRVAKAVGLEDVWNEYQHSEGRKLSKDVKRVVFTRVCEVLRSTYEEDMDDRYSMKDITTSWGKVTTKRRNAELKRFHLAFGREFQEDILVWHIATQVFLICVSSELISHDKNTVTLAKAVKELSEYLMFLIAVRWYMLPGLPLRRLYKATLKYLQELDTGCSSSSSTTREEKLARTLVARRKEDDNWGFGHDRISIVSDGANIANELLTADQSEMPELLELVFNVWVDKLLYAATRCSPESHAKQLSRGGDLTTIIWIMAQHVGPFEIGQRGPDDDDDDDDDISDDEMPREKKKLEKKKPKEKKAEEKKKKEAEEKKKKETDENWRPEQEATWGPYPPHMYPQGFDEPPPWDEFGGIPQVLTSIMQDPPLYDGPSIDPWVSDRPSEHLPIPPESDKPHDLKPPKRRRERRRRYATLYPVD